MTIGVLDIGNSAAKAGIFESGNLRTTFLESASADAQQIADRVVRRFVEEGVGSVGISSVVPAVTAAVEAGLRADGVKDVYRVSAGSRLPFRIDYRTPATLGVDRLAAAAGVYALPDILLDDAPVVIVDAGTAATIDVLDRGRFVGGPILAGPDLLRQAVGRGTAQLPEVDLAWPARATARSTAEAVNAGIMMGFVDAVRGMLLRVIDELGSQPEVIATGGWAPLLSQKVSLIGRLAPHLVLRGVAHLVQLNS
jgi:type III pantothenate kinase